MIQSFGAYAKEQAHQHSIHGIKKTRGHGGNRAERLEPALLFFIENFLRFFKRIDRFALATLSYFAQEIAHRLDPRDRFLAQFHSARFGDYESEIQPFQRIDAEIELPRCVRPQWLAAIAFRE